MAVGSGGEGANEMSFVSVEQSDGGALVRYDRGGRANALSAAAMTELTDAARHLRADTTVRAVVLTGTASPTVLITLLRCGVHGALDKAADFDELAQAVRSAAAGQTYVSQHLRSHLQARDLAHRATPASLSQGERDVLEGLSRGMNLSMIAQQRGRSPKTVSRQKSDAMRKLGLTGNHELHAFLRTYPIKGSRPS